MMARMFGAASQGKQHTSTVQAKQHLTSYIVLKSGTSEMSTKYVTAKFLIMSAVFARICPHTSCSCWFSVQTSTCAHAACSALMAHLVHLHAVFFPIMAKANDNHTVLFLHIGTFGFTSSAAIIFSMQTLQADT